MTATRRALVPLSLDCVDDEIRCAKEAALFFATEGETEAANRRFERVAAMTRFRRQLQAAAHQQRFLTRNVMTNIPTVGLVDEAALERFRRGDAAAPELVGLLVDPVPSRVFAFSRDGGQLVIHASARSLVEARHQVDRLGDPPAAIQYILVPDATLERDFSTVCDFVDAGDGHLQLLCERTGDVSGHFRSSEPPKEYDLPTSAPLTLLRSVSLDDVDDVIARALGLGAIPLERVARKLRAAILDERLALRPDADAIGVVDEAHFHRVVYGDLDEELPLLGILATQQPSKVVAFSWLHGRAVVEASAPSAADAEVLAARRFADADRHAPPEDDSPVDALHYLRVPAGMQERHFDAYCATSFSRGGAVVVRSIHTGDVAQLTRDGTLEEGCS